MLHRVRTINWDLARYVRCLGAVIVIVIDRVRLE